MAEIYVYAKDCEDFANFGLVGALIPTSCTFEEEANGMSEITMEHPLDEFGRYTHLIAENLLMVEVPVRTTPEINGGHIVTTVEQWTVRNAATITKAQRSLYKKSSGSRRLKYLDGGTVVTVVDKPAEGRYKVKCAKGTGYMDPAALEFTEARTIADNSQSIESVQPAWTVKPQLFRIYNVEKSIDSIKVSARHISYDLLYNLTSYENTGETTCIDALASIMGNCVSAHDFEAYTNIASKRTGLKWEDVNPIDALLNPEEGMTTLYSCSLVRDNWELYLLDDPGLNRGVTVEYGKNMLGLTGKEDYENIVTRVIPVGETKDGKPLYLSGTKYVDSARINDYAVPRTQMLKCDNCKVGTDGVTTAIARARMLEQAQAVFANGGDLPELEMSVDFVNLGDTADYVQYRDLERLFLWDYVLIRHKKLDIDVTARIVSIEWDCISGRMNGMEIGKVGKTLANSGITSWQIPTGFSGSKIANDTVGNAALKSDIIAARHLQTESINTEALQASCVTAEKIAAESVTADKIKADSITAVKIAANAVTADKIAAQTITGDKIAAQTITAVNIAGKTITAAQLVAGLITADSGLIDVGAINTAQIADGSITSAKIVSLNADVINSGTIKADRLLIAGENGLIYQINATSAGLTQTQLTEDQYKQQINGTVIVAKSITAAQIAAQTITGNEIAANTITAGNIDVASLFANEAFISELTTSRIFGGESLEIIAGRANDASRVFRQDDFPDSTERVKPGDMLVVPSTGQQYQAVQTGTIRFAMDADGSLHYELDGEGSLIVDGFDLYADGFTLSVDERGEVTGVPYGWELVQDSDVANTANDALDIANAALSQADFQRVVRLDNEGLHVGDNLTDYEVLLDSASVNIVAAGVRVSTFSDKFIRLDNMQIRKVRGGLAISVYRG